MTATEYGSKVKRKQLFWGKHGHVLEQSKITSPLFTEIPVRESGCSHRTHSRPLSEAEGSNVEQSFLSRAPWNRLPPAWANMGRARCKALCVRAPALASGWGCLKAAPRGRVCWAPGGEHRPAGWGWGWQSRPWGGCQVSLTTRCRH